MRLGQKSILFGSHQFILHPLMVAYGWKRHYGFWPRGWRTWLAIIIHDWGYWWCDDMDGPSGKRHPAWAAKKLSAWLDTAMLNAAVRLPADTLPYGSPWPGWHNYGVLKIQPYGRPFWFWFVGAHSRYFAEIIGTEPSPLMIPDKLATALLPRWLYCLLVWMSGEYREYVAYSHAVGHTEVPTDAWGYSGWLLNHWRGKFDQAGKTAVG